MIATFQEDTRHVNVERRWPRHQWDASGRSRWAGRDWRNYLYVVIPGLLISGDLLLKAALSKHGKNGSWWPFGLLAESSSGLSLLALLIVANGWLVDRSLADRTPGESLVPAWLRWLRRAAVSIPVLGLYAIPVWREIVQTRPAWAFRTSGLPAIRLAEAPKVIDSPFSRFRDRWRRLRRHQGQSLPALLLWVIAGQIVPWMALLSWVMTPEHLSSGHQKMLFVLSALCHVAACVFGLQYGVLRGRQMRAAPGKAAALRFAPLSFLFPFPVWIAGLLLWMSTAGEDAEPLVGRSHSTRTRPVAGTLENSETKIRQLAFYRLKTFLLILDAAALAWILAKLGGPSLGFELSTRQLFPFLIVPVLGVMVELSFLAIRVIGWLRRISISYQPYGRSLTLSQLALAGGLLFGPLLAGGQAANAGLLLTAIGIGTAIASMLLFAPVSFLLMLPGRQTLVTLAWAGLFFEISVTGLIMMSHPELAPPFLQFFTIAILFSPVWNIALFVGLKDWLLHPFELGHVFDRRLPGKTRAVLAAVVLAAIVPLGGIAVPFWIYAQHRLWPKYERQLWDLKNQSTSL